MRKFLIVAGVLLAALPPVLAAEIKEEATNTMTTVAGLFQPFWKAGMMDRESLFFFQRKDGEQAWAPLLFPPAKILAVQSVSGKTTYTEGKDFAVDRENAVLRLVPGSTIPFKTPEQMHPPADPQAKHSYLERGNPKVHLLANAGVFSDSQVEVTYTHHPDLWKGWVPSFQGEHLPHVMEKLKQKQPITLGVTGDSISYGYESSKSHGAPPFQPAYPELVALGLEEAYGSKVTLRNTAVGGWQSDTGVMHAGAVAIAKPDLVIIAFGMNDVVGKDTQKFTANIKAIMGMVRVVSPDAEFVLVAPMLANPEWSVMKMENFPAFRDGLTGLCGEGVVLADLTAVWTELLKRKSFDDLTGNGLNHPNDFGHRIYAEVILALLVPPDLAAPSAGKRD